MKARKSKIRCGGMLAILVLALGVMVLPGKLATAAPMGTAFTYQGRLLDDNAVADGLYDLQFKLFDDCDPCDPNVGVQLKELIDFNDLDVVDGYFTVELDFALGDPNAFNGQRRWLDVWVRPGDSNDVNDFLVLWPRQEVMPTPYALYAKSGAPGPEGRQGAQGEQGPKGDKGDTGDTGPEGPIGLTGPEGPQGPKGDTGATGAQGEQGIQGPIGLTGPEGSQGIQGEQGVPGPKGDTGDTGPQGLKGDQGDTGPQGPKGDTGDTGPQGPPGPEGTPGDSHWLISDSNTYYNDGNVGIGTSSPTDKLDVAGDINASSVYKIGGNTVLANPGTGNIFVGAGAGEKNTTGELNTFLGDYAGYFNTTGCSNAFLGSGAGTFNTIGEKNTFLGSYAGGSNTTGEQNTFLGRHAGLNNTTATHNTFLGDETGFSNTTGDENTFLGSYAGYSNTTGAGNVFIGCEAGFSETGSNKLYIANSKVGPPLIYGEFDTGKVGINTTSPAYDLDVNGDIRATGSVYYGGTEGNADGTAYTKPDYVFEEGYDVMSVEQVEQYLKQENHLPWMTSTKQEEEENGDVIDMTRMAFETVETAENLQLQLIGLNKLIKEQATLIKAQQNRIAALQETVAHSESLRQRLEALERMVGQQGLGSVKEVQQ